MDDKDKKYVDNSEITDSVMNCLIFAVKATREMGGIKEIGIKGYKFTATEFMAEANELVELGYLSRQMIFADSNDNQNCRLAGEQGNKNISGLYYALTEKGLIKYKNTILKSSEKV